MRRGFAMLLILLVTTISSAPAWALFVADHSCCAPAAMTGAANTQTAPAMAGKHAHCSRMAAHNVPQSPTSGSSVSVRHADCVCTLGAMQSPSGAMSMSALAAAVLQVRAEIVTIREQAQTLQAAVVREGRGPPPSFF